jgi:hypothetical protein
MKLAAVLGAFLVAARARDICVFPGTRHGAPLLRDAAVKGVLDGWILDHLPAAGGVRLAGIAFSRLPATAPQGAT